MITHFGSHAQGGGVFHWCQVALPEPAGVFTAGGAGADQRFVPVQLPDIEQGVFDKRRHRGAVGKGIGTLFQPHLLADGNGVSGPQSVETSLPDESGVVPVGNIPVHLWGNPVHPSIAGILPDAEAAGVGGIRTPLGQPYVKPAQPVHIQPVDQPVQIGVQHDVVSGLLYPAEKGVGDVGQRFPGKAPLGGVLHIQGHRILKGIPCDDVQEKIRFLFRLLHIGGITVVIGADGDTRLFGPLHVFAEPGVGLPVRDPPSRSWNGSWRSGHRPP